MGCEPCILFIECHDCFPGMMSLFPRSLEAGHLWQCRPPVLGCAWSTERRRCSLKISWTGSCARPNPLCSTPAGDIYLFTDVPEGSGAQWKELALQLASPVLLVT